jgi:hypothetical protein
VPVPLPVSMRRVVLSLVVGALCACGASPEPPAEGATAAQTPAPAAATEKADPLAAAQTAAAGQAQTARASAPPASAPEKASLTPESAKGVTHFELALTKGLRLGGFELSLRFDAERFVAAEPVNDGQLQGYMCASNTAIPGELRYNCVGIANKENSGVVAKVAIHHRDEAAILSDISLAHASVVDEMGSPAPEGVTLELR